METDSDVIVYGSSRHRVSFFFFFNDTATTEIYTLSLHDALPICRCARSGQRHPRPRRDLQRPDALLLTRGRVAMARMLDLDRKSTRLNSSHANISYAVFCLKKNNTPPTHSLYPLEFTALDFLNTT